MRLTLKQARLLYGATQVEMAARMGVSRDVYRRIEENPSSATIDQAIKLSKILELSVSNLFFGESST